MLSFLLALSHTQPQFVIVAAVEGEDALVRVIKQEKGLVTQFLIKEDSGSVASVASVTPGLDFDSATKTATGIVLTGKTYTAQIDVPKTGGVFSVAVKAKAPESSLKEARFGVELSEKATFSFPSHGRLVTHDQLLDPVGLVQGDEFGVAIMPDVADLATNRPMNPTLQVSASMVSYGFVAYTRDSDWNATRVDRNLDNPAEFSWRFDLLVSSAANAADGANRHLWSKYGTERALHPLPQTIPFRYYTKPAFDMQAGPDTPTGEEFNGQWWVSKTTGKKWRAPVGKDRQAKLTIDGNIVRFAWAMRWWGEHLEQAAWIDNADEVMNLAQEAPEKAGSTTSAFDVTKKEWIVRPFDAESAAYNARWTLRYVEDFVSTSREALATKVSRTAKSLLGAKPSGTLALFMQEVAESTSISDTTLKQSATEYLQKNRAALRVLARQSATQVTEPDVESVSLALALARLGEPEAKLLLTRMFLRQAVSKPATVTGTEVFGALTGQHFVSERQSAYSSDLFECAMLLGDKHYVERAIAALRAPLALYNHLANGVAGMFFPSTVAFGNNVSWFGNNGLANYGPGRGVAEGPGQTLASLADVYRKYGALYTHKAGWTVGIDGIRIVDGKVYNGFSTNPIAFEGVFFVDHVDASIDARTSSRDPEHYPAIRALTLTQVEGRVAVLALPGFSAIDAKGNLSGTFTFGDGSTKPAEFLPTGLGTYVTPDLLERGPVEFKGAYKTFSFDFKPTHLRVGPPAASLKWPTGWRRMLGLSDVIGSSVDHTVVSTADTGRGTRDKAQTGVIESVPFLLTQNAIAFTLLGDQGAGLTVELVDPATNIVIASDTKELNGPEEVVWELFTQVGQVVLFRIKDESKTGAIEVKDLRQTKAGP
jgi:hypothetical protein